MKAWSPAAWLALALAAAPANAQTMPPQEYMDRARELLAELIEIDTTDSERGDNTVAAHAMAELYGHIKENGGCEALVDKMTSRADLYDTIGYYDYEALDESIAKTIVPAAPGE